MSAGSRVGSHRSRGTLARLITLFSLALAVLLLVAACSSDGDDDDTSGDSDTGDTNGDSADDDGGDDDDGDERTSLVVGWPADVSTLDMRKASHQSDNTTLTNIYDSLVRRTADGGIEPALAESWEHNEDSSELTLNLRQDVTFHNGEHMTAEDVVYSLESLSDPDFPGQYAGRFASIANIEAPDDYTVVLTMDPPDALFLHSSPNFVSIVPKSLGEELGYDDFGVDPETAVGTGPYRVVEWSRDEHLVLEAFEDHWRGKAPIDDLTIRALPNEAGRASALVAGDVDMVGNLSLDHVEMVNGDPNTEVRQVIGPSRMRLTINTNREPMDQLEVRQAMAHALNLEAIVDNIYYGTSEVLPIFTVPSEIGFNGDLEPYGYDEDLARELLEDAGYPDGFGPLDFYARPRDPKAEEALTALAADLEAVGITTNIQLVSDDDYARYNEENDLDLGMASFRGGATFHAQRGMASLFHCSELMSGTWGGFWCDDEFEEIHDEAFALAATDPDASLDRFRDLQAHIHENYALLGGWSLPFVFGVHSDLDWEPPVEGANWMYNASWQ